MGASLVRYDGFLLSSAATITPTFAWYGSRAALNARGTYLRFESGNRSIQGSVVGTAFARPAKDWRIEASGTAGASSYADFASFWHLLGEFRIRRDTDRGGVWLAATGGRTAFGSPEGARPVFAASVTALQRRSWFALLVTAGRAFVGDTQYSDIGMTARGQYGKFVLETVLAARVWSQGAGHGVYGEASGSLPFADRWAFVISGGRYPSDPINGSIAGRYLSAGLRFRIPSPARPVPSLPLRHSGANGGGGDDPPPSTTLTVVSESSGNIRLVLRAPPATLVEIAGDFSDWQPVSMTQTAGGSWEVVLPMAKGVHQINVRLDGGPWTVPGGTTRLVGDYGDEVGTFIVP
ncbi:MAG TPA: glycogen-binding domain-containing protein [Gemmatimonadales bacterium]|nr:glycogen-binding domain-containing protein [Gemmatimonadales bacterium]